MLKKLSILALLLSLVGFTVSCNLSGGILDSDPNRADQVPLLSQLVALQPIAYGFYLGDVGVYASVWMQQMAGVAHQYLEYEVYEMTNARFSWFGQMYQEGGLIDIKVIKERAQEEGRMTILGLAKMYEALMFASGADVWGDIPYSEAARTDIQNPHYDEQQSVHNACLQLLDQAIAHFQAAEAAGDFFDGSNDFSFGGDRNKMIAAAHSLKARILLNWAEVNNGNYALALAEAQQGIGNVASNWMAPFRDVADERNIYYQFNSIRGQYIKGGAFMVELLRGTNDPRLEFYYGEDQSGTSGARSGSAHGEFNTSASWLNPTSTGDPGWDLDILSYEETQFIIAECQYNTGNEAGALATLNAVLGTIESRWGFDANSIQRYSGLTGVPLLEAIMMEKYKALFLNPQTWSDWKRTGFPRLESKVGRPIPRRYMYSEDEKNANQSFPGVKGLWERNDNDPSDPSYF